MRESSGRMSVTSRRIAFSRVATLIGCGAFSAFAFATPVTSVTADLTTVNAGVMIQAGGKFIPHAMTLTREKPTFIKKEPGYLGTPVYGILHFGPARENRIAVALDSATEGKNARLFLDPGAAGDLTATKITLTRHAVSMRNAQGQEDEEVFFEGNEEIRPPGVSGAKLLNLVFYTFAPASLKKRRLPEGTLFYYRDYGQIGKITLGGKSYAILLSDELAAGRYDTVTHGQNDLPRVALLIDRDGDGKFDPRYERYDLNAPFTIGGVTYEVDKISEDGSKLTLKVSSKSVPEIPIPRKSGE